MENFAFHQPKRLLIVDDSKIMRKFISSIFAEDDTIEVVGEAANGTEALRLLQSAKPDVITLDVQMPIMDGLTTLKTMMIHMPTPTIMFSAFTQEGSKQAFNAFKYGAVDIISKPTKNDNTDIQDTADEIAAKVHLASRVQTDGVQYIRLGRLNDKSHPSHDRQPDNLVAIGASEGGYSTLLKIIPHLSPDQRAAYLVVLYAPIDHIDAFTSYLNNHSNIEVKRAQNGEVIKAGTCYLASGYEYLTVHNEKGRTALHVRKAPFATIRGSINMLMFSVADLMADKSVGVILTGAGNDGQEGMEELQRVGGAVLVQTPTNCLHKEMPEAALAACGNTPDTVSDKEMAAKIVEILATRAELDSKK